jgi:hypothetical protein
MSFFGHKTANDLALGAASKVDFRHDPSATRNACDPRQRSFNLMIAECPCVTITVTNAIKEKFGFDDWGMTFSVKYSRLSNSFAFEKGDKSEYKIYEK